MEIQKYKYLPVLDEMRGQPRDAACDGRRPRKSRPDRWQEHRGQAEE